MPFEKTFKRLDPDKLEVIRRKLQEEYDARDSADFFGFKEVRRARKTLAIGARETYTQGRIKGGGNRGSAPPWACQGGALPPPEILASKKSKEDLEELCYFIHNILNPNDPLLREKFPRRVYLII